MTIMKSMKRIIAIALCFSLVFISSSYVQVSAKYNHKAYMKKVDQFMKNMNYELDDDSTYKRMYKYKMYNEKSRIKWFSIFFGKSKKDTRKVLRETITRTAFIEKTVIKYHNKNTLWITSREGKGYIYLLIKKNIKKCRLIAGIAGYKKKPKAKQVKKTKRSLLKTVNKLDRF